jgi:ABC-type branched-subunit amino acid transport system ATPase component
MANSIFVLTGAGISAESGLGTFRDKDGQGIWARFDPMKLATPEAFARDPERVLAFYDLRRRNLLNAQPNAAHRALARLEQALFGRGGHLTLVTQNIDDLHERAVYWEARLMIMDEPTNNLGVPEQHKVLELIRTLKGRGVPVILITHVMPDAFAVTDRVVVMHRGRKVAEKTTARTSAEELVQYMVGARNDAAA